MTTPTVINLYSTYLMFHPNPKKELVDVKVKDIVLARKIESETARELEVERQIDEMLILAENN